MYTSINTIFRKVNRDTPFNMDEADMIEWAGESLEAIGAEPALGKCIAFIEVKNHQVAVPNGLHSIIGIARYNRWDGTSTDDMSPLCPAVTSSEVSESSEDDEDALPVALDCNGTPIHDYELAYYRPYYDLQADYFGWSNAANFRNNWSPVRLATNTFFGSVVYEDEGYDTLYTDISGSGYDEYQLLDECKIIRFGFKEGFVAIGFDRQVTDSDGFPMIFDNFSYKTAVTKYITYMYLYRQWLAGREGLDQKVAKLEADWQWYCGQAGNSVLIPQGVDQHENLLKQRRQLLPKDDRYYGFFGNLSRESSRKYNDPDYRNRTYYRGYSLIS